MHVKRRLEPCPRVAGPQLCNLHACHVFAHATHTMALAAKEGVKDV